MLKTFRIKPISELESFKMDDVMRVARENNCSFDEAMKILSKNQKNKQ